nr:ferric-chelate reductase 1-like [Pseudochaenichthys georgianus]
MWLWIVISLDTITKVHGYSDGRFPESCDSMSPVHTNRNGISYEPQSTGPPFEITYDPAPHGHPITVYLKSKQSNKFTGFMLEARKTEDVVGPAVGKFIVLDSRETRLLSCHSSPDNAVSQKLSSEKRLLAVNWTSPQEENLDYTFRATFLQNFETFWEAVDLDVKLTAPSPTTTSTPSTTLPTTTLPTTTTPITTSTTTPITTTPITTSTTTPITTTPITTSTTTPIITNTTTPRARNVTKLQQPGTVLMIADSVLVAVKTELPLLITLLINGPRLHHLNKKGDQ